MIKLDPKGVTLIELIIVVSIIAILVVALGFSFQGWMGGYRIESQVKEMHVDLMNARARAMQRNRAHFVTLTTTSYTLYEDDSNGVSKVPDGDGIFQPGTGVSADTKIQEKTLNNAIATTTAATINLTTRGTIPLADAGTINVTNPLNADYDCIVIAQTRINIGQMSGGACVVK